MTKPTLISISDLASITGGQSAGEPWFRGQGLECWGPGKGELMKNDTTAKVRWNEFLANNPDYVGQGYGCAVDGKPTQATSAGHRWFLQQLNR